MDLGICISERILSCILAPPAAANITKGVLNFIQLLTPAIILLPTDMPIDPPINKKF